MSQHNHSYYGLQLKGISLFDSRILQALSEQGTGEQIDSCFAPNNNWHVDAVL